MEVVNLVSSCEATVSCLCLGSYQYTVRAMWHTQQFVSVSQLMVADPYHTSSICDHVVKNYNEVLY